MNFHFSPPCVGLAILFIFLCLFEKNHAFMQTSPILAWSNAPGASFQQLSTQFSPQDSLFNSPVQLPFASTTSRPFCPSGSSSLLILILSSSAQQSSLKNGFLSSSINRQFNSVSELARFHSNNFPNSLTTLWTSELPKVWSSLCQGGVIIKKLRSDEDIDTAFHESIQGIDDNRLVIFTTPISMTESILSDSTKAANQKRQLSNMITENTTSHSNRIPSSKPGLFWRYSFLSDYLIIGTLVMVLLFIPPVILGSFALQSIESPKGLKTKMAGQVSEVMVN